MELLECINLEKDFGDKRVLKDINLKNDEVIMLGDSLTSDITGALNAKIKQIWLDLSNLNIKGDYIIVHSLKEALDVIKKEI